MKRGDRRRAELQERLHTMLWILVVASVFFLTGALVNASKVPQEPLTAPELGFDVAAAVPEPDYPDLSSEDEAAHSMPPAADVPYAQAAGEKPILAIIVDDGGGQMELTRRIAATELHMTWAILPYTRFATDTALLAKSKRIPYMLHLPMQAQSDKDGSREYLIGNGMSAEEITQATAKALNSLPGVIGLNNHRGSLATSNAHMMEPVMAELKKRGLIFVDSRTSGKSVAYDTAKAAGVPTLRNRGFLDGSPERKEMEKRFNETVRLAQKRGDAVIICHFRHATVSFLESLSGDVDSLPVRLVTVPEMLELLGAKGR